ncbi:MAG: hypothetical protein J1E62_00115 [Lachnospiraceae bacterium]|nr:hypothetical protein [Lachnospiraceae bacterium]
MLDNVSLFENQSVSKEGAIWKQALAKMLDPTSDMPPERKKQYEQKIYAKLKAGKRLTPKEMNYLKVNNPTMYNTARRIEIARQAFRERLKHCHSKEEVQDVIANQMKVVEAMSDADPDKEYMAAMVKNEADEFRDSKAYAKLPQKADYHKKGKMEDASDYKPKDEKDEDSYSGVGLLLQGQFQCNVIDGLAQSFSLL